MNVEKLINTKSKSTLFLGHGYVSQFLSAHNNPENLSITASINATKDKFFKTPSSVKTINFLHIDEKILDLHDNFVISIPPLYALKTDAVIENFHQYFLNRKAPYTLIYLSATSVYGDHDGKKVQENSPLKAQSVNGIARIACEKRYQELQQNNAANIIILRLAAIYGDKRNTLVSIQNQAITSNKNTNRVISRTHVLDITNIITRIIVSNDIQNRVFNVADDNPCSSKVLNDYICEKLLQVAPLPVINEAKEVRHDSFALDNKIVDNTALKKTLDYAFVFPSYKEGFSDIFKGLNSPKHNVNNNPNSMKIAIIGSGISGLSCAWLLNQKHDITVFEKNNYIGGHSNTASISYDNEQIAVDTGFIVFNFKTYPNLKGFFELLEVPIEKSNMSFGIKDLDTGFEYSGNDLAGVFAQKKNLLNLKFLKMLKDIVTFNKKAIQLVEKGSFTEGQSLGSFVDSLQLGSYFKNYYLFPMAGAIWSCPLALIKDYPAKTFLQFFYNHGLLTVTNQPQWYTVKGGSKEYVKKMTHSFKDKIKLGCHIVKSQQSGDKIILEDAAGNQYTFDHVIFASHGDQTYHIIADKTEAEASILSNITYSQNTAVLHKSSDQMPVNKSAWASWVYLSSQKENKVSLSYWMNNLQHTNPSKPLFVTLNPIAPIPKEDIFGTYHYEHPIFDDKAVAAQQRLHHIQGKRNMWFCGAWTKYGFHEDGLNSALEVVKHFGVNIPWKK